MKTIKIEDLKSNTVLKGRDMSEPLKRLVGLIHGSFGIENEYVIIIDNSAMNIYAVAKVEK